jgi:uncharacterized membrane protein
LAKRRSTASSPSILDPDINFDARVSMTLLSNPFLLVHTIAATLALPVGAALFLMTKGTPRHRAVGFGYIALMLVANLSIMPVEARIAPIGGTGLGIFHILAFVSLASLSAGIYAMVRWLQTKNPESMRSHQINMAFSYLGLVMAFASELLVNRNLGLSPVNNWTQFWTLLAVVNIGLYVGGTIWIMRTLRTGDPLTYWRRASVTKL